MDLDAAEAFAADWAARWNSHDLDRVLEHYATGVVFVSPVAQRVVGQATISGKDALRSYWTTALARVPDLHFTVTGVQVGTDVVVINYLNQQGTQCSEVLQFDGARIVRGWGTYGRARQE